MKHLRGFLKLFLEIRIQCLFEQRKAILFFLPISA